MAINQESKKRRAKLMLWSIVFILFSAMVLPFTSYIYTGVVSAQSTDANESNPRANYWRAVRGGGEG